MTQRESEQIIEFFDKVFRRINRAEDYIREQNYGLALDALKLARSEPLTLPISEDKKSPK